jgi:hypothetical protein
MWSLSLRFSHQNTVHASPLTHACYVSHPSHSSRFYHPNNIRWGVQNIKRAKKIGGICSRAADHIINTLRVAIRHAVSWCILH